ncbi:P-loop containing nucleoside triphosphate hydrolase protein [Thozetella sp. PMI_491]|nr:P-loop containing nucleoside triphosphate hydrolase protein [Thozetella sp. PMI_491]
MRKSKGYAVTIPAHESLMTHVTAQMDIPAKLQAVRDINGDDFAPAPPQLRLPQKHFESGSKLQQRILGELSCRSMPQPSGGKKLMSKHKARVSQGSNPTGEHQLAPQIAPLFESIRTGLSAFDKSQCENAMWTQKYAPTSASEVLQPGREAFMLRDWLQALIVQSVHTGSGDGEKPKKGKSSAPKKKKKKKLDDFIVSSDEEDNEMNEVSDNEADWLPSGGHGIMKKTVVRSGDLAGRGSKEGTRVTNIVVISGPHGCGKTAAVYAAAKELDFEVFEINSSSRRSGKDIMERIGDMTTNHLVQHRQVEEQDQPAPAAQDETEKEVKSGKQATMNAFFKATPATAKAKKAVMPAQVKPEKEAKAEASSKSQKQSLILLDEADILYDKDQQFWTTIVTLAAQSKRPFIITCNDETLLPLQSLALHAIMRFSPPPVSLAVDRLLLIAANEGHALKRQPVEALYKSRHQDLRAATTDLNYWCQIGTGDRRGGFEWFYPRWPKGVDLDENKEVVRVVSEDTYQRGMNWLGRDSAVDLAVGPTAIEEELLAQCWDSWQLDLEHWHASEDLSTWANSLDALASAPASDKLAALDAYGMLADAMSAADLCSYGSFGLFKQESIDATLPPLPDKAREDFICGLRPLDTPLLTRYNSLATSIPCAIKSLSQSSLRKHANAQHAATVPALPPLEQPRLFDSIENQFTTTQPYTPAVARIDFAFAFDPIAVADTSSPAPVTYLDPSVFDRTLKLIVLDVAPYVRGIVAYETYLQKQREKLSSVLGEGGKNGQGRKRMRTTRAALSALEGGSRSTTRGERWFKADMNPVWVMKTAGDAWGKWVMDLTVSPPASPARSAESSASESPPESKGRKRKVKARVVQDDSADELA